MLLVKHIYVVMSIRNATRKMSQYDIDDLILSTFELHGSLSTKDVARILEEEYNKKTSLRAIQRRIKKLREANLIVPDTNKQGREQTYSLAKKLPLQRQRKEIRSEKSKLPTMYALLLLVSVVMVVAFSTWWLIATKEDIFFMLSISNSTIIGPTTILMLEFVPFIPVFVAITLMTLVLMYLQLTSKSVDSLRTAESISWSP